MRIARELWSLSKMLLRVKENIRQSLFESSPWKNKAIKKYFTLVPPNFRLFIPWLVTTNLCPFERGRKEMERSGRIERGIAVQQPIGRPFSVARMHEFPAGQVNIFLWSKLGLSLLEVLRLWELFATWRAKGTQTCQIMEVTTLTLTREYLGLCQMASTVNREV